MKREQIAWKLRDAFPQEPQACHDALMHAACSVREEKKMKRISWRMALLAVLILLATLSAAVAVSQWMGWTDLFMENYNIHVTDGMQKQMDATEQRSFQVGPLTLTLRQCLADGRVAISNFEVCTTDGSAALYVGDVGFYDPIGAMGDTEAKRLGVDPEITWAEAAKQLNLPLFNVRALMEITSSANAGESMEDMLWSSEGKLSYFNLSYLEPAQVKESLPVNYYLSVSEFNPATGEMVDHWLLEEADEISVLTRLDEKHYAPSENFSVNGFQVEEVWAELYDTGVYFMATLHAPQGMKADDREVYALSGMAFTDENGQAFPMGIMYSELNRQQWPLVRIAQAASLEELPQRIMLDGMVLE